MTTYPTFIGGFRSGSTLLVNYLGLHPRISAIYETKFLADLLRIARLLLDENGRGQRELAIVADWVGDPALSREKAVEILIQRSLEDISLTQKVLEGSAPDGKAPHERYALGSNHILWSAAEAMQAIGPFLQEVRSGGRPNMLLPVLASGMQELFSLHTGREYKSYWINKTPEILRFFPELRRMLGRVRLIHLIRDGRDVVHSSAKLNWWSVEAGAKWWKIFIEDVRTQASHYSDDYLELRYEEFVVDHAGSLRKVFDFLEIEGTPEEIINAQERHAPGSTRPAEALRRTGQWRSGMSGDDRTVFKTIANDLLVSLGYAKDTDW
ncbi:MAG: sulfotransferase [Nitrospiraceae bacterium]|nr:sulfotransferase [Nitrospiraceae bacterium]